MKQYHFEICPTCGGERMIDQYGNPPTTYVPNSGFNAYPTVKYSQGPNEGPPCRLASSQTAGPVRLRSRHDSEPAMRQSWRPVQVTFLTCEVLRIGRSGAGAVKTVFRALP